MYLLDTNVISSIAPSRRANPDGLAKWLHAASDGLFLSVVSASEIFAGIRKKESEGAFQWAIEMREWWRRINAAFGPRILPFDMECAIIAGNLVYDFRAFDPGYEDIAIAATAKVHGLTVLTGNVRHFEPLGVPVVNPFVALPELPSSR